MKQRYHNSQKEVKGMDSAELREQFLIGDLMASEGIRFTYSHYDRIIVGGAVPKNECLKLENFKMLRAEFFLERREMGVINVGGAGTIGVDGQTYNLDKKDCLYIGRGNKEVSFTSKNAANPAQFYILSAPAHKEYPTSLMKGSDVNPVVTGAPETSNHRKINKYIYADGIQSCQLVMGLTVLEKGSVWNTMPAHVHDRRMEVYFYFELAVDQTIFHFMGEPQETRHITIQNNQAVISPPWSIHAGCGTSNYSFIWGMGGENQDYGDMDAVKIIDLR